MKRAKTATHRRTRTSSLERVQRALRRVRPELSTLALRPKASLMTDLGVDSLKFAELSIALEEEFGRPIFLGDVLSDVEDPSALTVEQLAEHLDAED